MKKKKKDRAWLIILLIIFLGVFTVSGYMLFKEVQPYIEEAKEHEELLDSVVIARTTATPSYTDKPKETSSPVNTDGSTAIPDTEATSLPAEDTEIYEGPDFDIDWDKLLRINKEVIGWLYIDAMPEVSYPVLQAKNNDKYLHFDLYGKWQKNGCLFVDCGSSPDWSDPNTVIFGHHMKSGAMFGKLEKMDSQSLIDEHPYFWILTPEDRYCYRIFSVRYVHSYDDVYSIFWPNIDDFVEWGRTMGQKSSIHTDVTITETDHVVVLSTCAYTNYDRFVVAGVRVEDLQEVQETQEP